jgi:hypothetical protein
MNRSTGRVIPSKYRAPGVLRPRGSDGLDVTTPFPGLVPFSGSRPGDGYERDTVLKYSIALPDPTKPWTFELKAPGGVELTIGMVGMSAASRS